MTFEAVKTDLSIHLPDRYAEARGDAGLVYHCICRTLAGRNDAAGWDRFGEHEWELLARMAEPAVEGVGPLLFWQFRAAGWPAAMPRTIRQALERSYYNTLAYNLLQFKELEAVSRAYGAANIPLVILKGASLAASVYEDEGLRPMGDLDVLVPLERLGEAVALARRLGFDRGMTEKSPWLNRLLSHHVHLRKQFDHNEIALEIHHTLVGTAAYRFGAPVDWFWSQLEPVGLPVRQDGEARETEVQALNPTAQLLFLSAHAYLQHGSGVARLLWLYDMDQLIRLHGGRIRYETLFEQAEVFHWTPAVAEALSSIRAIFDTPVPEVEIAAASGRIERGIEDLVSLKRRGPRSRTELAGRGLRSVRLPARLFLFLAILFPHPDYIRWLYRPRPAWKWPLYYPYRWLDLLRDALNSMRGQT